MKLKSEETLRALLLDGMAACVKCGACMVNCPLYRQDRDERAGMRGKIALLQAWKEGWGSGPLLPGSRTRVVRRGAGSEPLRAWQVRGALAYCVGCQSCRAACPNGVDTVLVTLLGRHFLPRTGLRRLMESLLGLLLARPVGRAVYLAWAAGMTLGKIIRAGFSQGKSQVLRARQAPRGSRVIPEFCNRGIETVIAAMADQSEAKQSRVSLPNGRESGEEALVFFPGCRIAGNRRLLEQAKGLIRGQVGDEPLVLEGICCGAVALAIPDLELFQRLLGAWLDRVREIRPRAIVLACPHCWESLARARDLCDLSGEDEKLLDSVTDLYSLLESDKPAGGKKIREKDPRNTRHGLPRGRGVFLDACTNSKNKAFSQSSRAAAVQVFSEELLEIPLAGGGCGCRGSFGAAFPATDAGLVGRSVELARELGGEVLVTNCSSCLGRFRRALSGGSLRCYHLIEILAEASESA